MQDVYAQKLDNVRSFILNDGWSDDIAERAYAYNFYFLSTVLVGFAFWGGFIFLILGAFAFMMRDL